VILQFLCFTCIWNCFEVAAQKVWNIFPSTSFLQKGSSQNLV